MSRPAMAYDLVGDVHGHAGLLEALLTQMGYTPQGRSYRPPQGRQLVMLGDLIDRGPEQLRVLEIARAMVDAGHAQVVMGNHEFNAIAYATPDPHAKGECYRANRAETHWAVRNRHQHAAFLEQVGEGSAQHREWLHWFRTLPPVLDLGGVRAVHGSWHDDSVATLAAAGWTDGRTLDDALLALAHDDASPVKAARKRLTCGLELDLPPGRSIRTKDGLAFDNLRIADWRHEATALQQIALLPPVQAEVLAGLPWPEGLRLQPITGAPVFIGHHWFSGQPAIEGPKLACLDWSAARGGALVGYRWDGEAELANDKLVWVHGA